MNENYIGGIKKETYDLLFKDENISNSENIDTSANDEILDRIATFTKLKNFISIEIAKRKFNISYDRENKEYIYNTANKEIPFKRFSDLIIDKELKSELLSNIREHKCHARALQLVDAFSNPITILTGTYERHGEKFLHSVIEMDSKNSTYIIDYTLNLLMKKELYLELTQFKLIETMQDIEAMEDKRDGIWEFLNKTDFMLKPYLTFQKEIKKDLEKNSKMLEKIDDKKLDNRIEEMKKQREEER